MLRRAFDNKKRRLRDEVLVLGSHVEDTLTESVQVLKRHNIQAALDLIANNRNINRKCASIETGILTLLATQQPMASDLRILASILQVALELKRVGLHAKEIAGMRLRLNNEVQTHSFDDIVYMARLSSRMLNDALTGFANQDIALARAIPDQDDAVDDLYKHIHLKVLAAIEVDQTVVGSIIYLSQVAHHLERVADRAINICEWVIYEVTGEMKELNVDVVV